MKVSVNTLWTLWMWVCTIIITIATIGSIAFEVYGLFNRPDMNSRQIESCLDGGGTWNDDQKICVHAS